MSGQVRQLFSFIKKLSARTSGQLYEATVPAKQLPPSATSMQLSSVVRKLNGFAPTSMAGSWDNVGLLVEPSPPLQVSKILLTNDLTEPVLKEAVEFGADMVYSYHPPIFTGMKRLTQATWKERIVIKCLENRIAIYSPHTAIDALSGGVNDWLLKPFDGSSEVIEQINGTCPTAGRFRLDVSVPSEQAAQVEQDIMQINGTTLANKNQYASGDDSFVRLSFNCTSKGLPKVVALTAGIEDGKSSTEIIALSKPPIPDHGPGRIMKLRTPISLTDAVNKVKKHVGMTHIRLANAVGVNAESDPVKKIAVCAGSGASVLRGVEADLYITGEMSHHEVLDATHRGIHVVLCEHSNTERGYFKDLQEKLNTLLESRIELRISKSDSDPLKLV